VLLLEITGRWIGVAQGAGTDL